MYNPDNPFDYLTSLTNKGLNKKKRVPSLIEHTVSEEHIDAEIDICSMIRDVINDDSRMPRDLKIDDSAMPLAKNFYEWTTDESFAGNMEKPFLEQLITGVILFSEWCPRCSETEWLFHDHKVADTFVEFEKKVCCLELGVCPSCGARKSELVNNKEMAFYWELAMRCGQRSGKSAVTGGQLSTYITHRLLKLQKPNTVYELMPSNMLHGTFVALTYQQAKDTLWEYYYGTLLESPWFQAYHAMLRDYEQTYGEKLLKFNDTFVQYRHRNFTYYPAGPDMRVLRGRTRIQSAVDEIGYFDNDAGSKKVKMSAKGVYEALERSLLTIRAKGDKLLRAGYDNILTGYFTNVSSPCHIRDMICELTRRAEHSKRMHGKVLPTWEMNPNITREDLEEEFLKDPVTAMKDYGAEPPLTSNPFLPSIAQLEEAVADSKRNGIKLKYYQRKAKDGSLSRYAKIVKIRKSNRPSVLGIDAGYSNNSFSIAVGSDVNGTLKFDIIAEVMPLPGIPLNYTLIYDNVIAPIIEARNVKVVVADRWNSLKLLSDMELEFDIITKQYSLKYRDFWNIKTMFEQTSVMLPSKDTKDGALEDILNFPQDEYPRVFEHRPSDHLLVQCATVQDTGSQVIKGDGLTDDSWRAVSIALWALDNDDYYEALNGDFTESATSIMGPLGVSRLGSGSGGGSAGKAGTTSTGLALGSSRSCR